MGDFQQVLQVVPPSPVVVFPTYPRTITVPTPAPVITYNPPVASVAPTVAVERLTSGIIPAIPASGSAPVHVNATTSLSTFGLINPNITMETKDIPYFIPYSYLSELGRQDPLYVSTIVAQTVNASTINTSTLNATTANIVSSFSQNVYTSYIEATESYVYDKLTLDNQELTANATELLLNGNPIVTANNISSIADWSKDPAISTIRANGNDLTGVRYGYFSSINADTMTVNKLTYLYSTTVETYESTIQSDIKLANISSLNAGVAFVSSLTVSTLTAGNYIASSNTVNDLTVNHNFTVNSGTGGTTTFNQAPIFTTGATFNTTAPTFNAGLNTASINVTGATNFNNNGLNNVGTISADNVTTQGKYTNSVNANVGSATSDWASPATVNIKGVGGLGGIVNVTADVATVLNPGATVSQVNIEAKGNSGVAFLAPRGGKVSLIANAGSTSLTPTTGLGANGAIELTAYSFINGAFSVPGVIKQSAGSCSMYAGAVSPVTGILGYNYIYGTLGNVIVAGSPPSLPAFPTTNYLYGEAGTSIKNGLYTDNIFSYGTGNLNITAQSGYWVDIRRTQYLGMGNNPVIDGGSVNGVIQNFSNVSASEHNGTNFTATGQVKAPLLSTMNINLSSINGSAYTPGGGGTWVGTATTDLNMNNFNINNTSTINFPSPGGGGTAGYIAKQYGLSGSLLVNDGTSVLLRSPTNIFQTPTGNTIWSIKDTGAIVNQPGGTQFNTDVLVSSINATPFPNVQGAVACTTATTNVTNTNITATSLILLTPSMQVANPYWVTNNAGSGFTINISSFSGYVNMNYLIASYKGFGLTPPSIIATGGTITTSGGRQFHTFTTSGTFAITLNAGATVVEVFMIGGGGGGGGGFCGGGGGGGGRVILTSAYGVGSYPIVIGTGGTGGIASTSVATNGTVTTFSSGGSALGTALGGGAGGTYNTALQNGANGGCGGGNGFGSGGGTGSQGGNGGDVTATYDGGGGGGGGGTTPTTQNGATGVLYYSSYYAGGGGGGGNNGSVGTGGTGGGGRGGKYPTLPQNGVANTGGGGGGAGLNYSTGNQGGSGGTGICIVSYAI